MFKKNITHLFIAVLALGLILLANGIILAWTPPTANPPSANVAAPINISATAQTKTGSLNIGGLLKVGGGLSYFITKLGDSFALQNNAGTNTVVVGQDGHVGIGIESPSEQLEVSGINESGRLKLNKQDPDTIRSGEVLGELMFSGDPAGAPKATGAKITAVSQDFWLDEPALPKNYETDMIFYTRLSGGDLQERMRITGTGDVKLSNGLPPDYDSGWFFDNAENNHTTRLNHNLGDFPRHMQIWWASPYGPTTINGPIYPIDYWHNDGVWVGPQIELYPDEIRLEWYGSGWMFRHYRVSTGTWFNYDTGYVRVLLWK